MKPFYLESEREQKTPPFSAIAPFYMGSSNKVQPCSRHGAFLFLAKLVPDTVTITLYSDTDKNHNFST